MTSAFRSGSGCDVLRHGRRPTEQLERTKERKRKGERKGERKGKERKGKRKMKADKGRGSQLGTTV